MQFYLERFTTCGHTARGRPPTKRGQLTSTSKPSVHSHSLKPLILLLSPEGNITIIASDCPITASRPARDLQPHSRLKQDRCRHSSCPTSAWKWTRPSLPPTAGPTSNLATASTRPSRAPGSRTASRHAESSCPAPEAQPRTLRRGSQTGPPRQEGKGQTRIEREASKIQALPHHTELPQRRRRPRPSG